MKVTESEFEVVINMQLMSCGWELDPRKINLNVYKQQASIPPLWI